MGQKTNQNKQKVLEYPQRGAVRTPYLGNFQDFYALQFRFSGEITVRIGPRPETTPKEP
jgi:hypothetical protein